MRRLQTLMYARNLTPYVELRILIPCLRNPLNKPDPESYISSLKSYTGPNFNISLNIILSSMPCV
jgi:hypothetical protein